MLIGKDDISNDVVILGECVSIFVYICACLHFALIGRNLTAQSTGSHRGTGRGIQIPETYIHVVARSPSFSRPAARAPRRSCSQAGGTQIQIVQQLERSKDKSL